MTDGHSEDSAGASARPEAAAQPVPASETQSRGAASPAPAAKPAPARHRGRITGLVAAIVVVLAVAASAPFWVPILPWSGTAAPSPRPAEESALQATEARLAQLETKVQNLAAAASARPTDATALAALGSRVAALEQRPQTPAVSPQDLASLHQDVAALSARLDAVAAAQTAQASSDHLVFTALAALRAAVVGSGPFDRELAAATALAHGDGPIQAALKPLAASSSLGLPSAALLAQHFAAVTAPAIFRAAAAAEPAAENGWVARVLARIRALVTVRRVDRSDGDATAAAVARAQQALDSGDLAAAIAALKPLTGAPAAAAAPWVALAQRRLDAEDALGRMLQQVAARIVAESH